MQINEQLLIEKIRRLPPEKQQEVFDFVEEIEQKAGVKKIRRVGGALEHLGLHISAEEIDEARREMWRNFPRNDI